MQSVEKKKLLYNRLAVWLWLLGGSVPENTSAYSLSPTLADAYPQETERAANPY